MNFSHFHKRARREKSDFCSVCQRNTGLTENVKSIKMEKKGKRWEQTVGKVEENKQQKEQSLLNTAFRLFTTKGIIKTSVSDIAQQAGVAKGTFYLYFRDKYDIQNKLIAHKTEQMFRHALDHSDYRSGGSAADKVIAIIDDILDQMQRDPGLLRFINKHLSWGIFSRAVGRSSIDYLSTFREILELGDMGETELQMTLYTIIELVGAACHSVILEQDPVSLEQYKPYLYRSVRAIIEAAEQ